MPSNPFLIPLASIAYCSICDSLNERPWRERPATMHLLTEGLIQRLDHRRRRFPAQRLLPGIG